MADVQVERHGHVMVCRLNRPERRNAIGGTFLRDFLEAIREAGADDTVRVVVTVAAGPAWCIGADVDEFSAAAGTPLAELWDGNSLGGEKGVRPLSPTERRIDEFGSGRWTLEVMACDKPLVAAIDGAAAGGGFGLALLHDFRLVSERALFAAGWVRLGIGPEFGTSYLLPRLLGRGVALDLLLTGRRVGAAEAVSLGLATRQLPSEGFEAAALAFAEELAALPPLAVQATKRSVVRSADHDLTEQLRQEWRDLDKLFGTEDLHEALAAFRGKRAGRFQGR